MKCQLRPASHAEQLTLEAVLKVGDHQSTKNILRIGNRWGSFYMQEKRGSFRFKNRARKVEHPVPNLWRARSDLVVVFLAPSSALEPYTTRRSVNATEASTLVAVDAGTLYIALELYEVKLYALAACILTKSGQLEKWQAQSFTFTVWP